MNNIPPIPQLGIYVSKIDPTLRITVTDVDIVDGEDDSPDDELFYLVHWIEGEDESDMTAMGFELDPVEWQAFVESVHGFNPRKFKLGKDSGFSHED